MDLRLSFDALLGNTYRFERELTGGGMARVFVAEETRLGRKVVVKALAADLAGTISIERFTREIHLLARLQHPHIIPLLTAGDVEGIPYYTMPFVQGESLRHRLAALGKLEIDDALTLASEVADALAYAHGEGIIHRDIKPGNILLSGGHALVTDFGIAKALDASRTQDQREVTMAGMLVGTPAYISPEQAAGDAIDGRCDIYSLGVVLYEMITGKPPFAGATAAAVLAKRFMGNPPPIRTIDATVPSTVERTVERAMAQAPDDRFATASELILALRSAIGADAVASASAVRPRIPGKSIAVLPFANRSGDADGEYFSDGITEEIINALVQLSGLRVAARTSSFAFKGRTADVREIGRQLGVGTVLEGSVRRAGRRIRIAAELVNVADGYHLWSERYDRDLEDVFAIQDEIAQAIAQKLQVTLGVDTARIVRPGTASLEAYDLYLRGRSFWLRRGRHVETARGFFERAVAIDPDFPSAHAGLADCDSIMAAYGYLMKPEIVERARHHAHRAVALDPKLAEAHYSVGLFEGWINGQFKRADVSLQRAGELNPAWGLPVAYRAFFAAIIGRPDDSPAFARAAREIEPVSPLVHTVAAMGLAFTRRYDEAWDGVQRALEIDDRISVAQLVLGWVHHRRRQFAEGAAAHRKAVEDARSPVALASLAILLVDAGDHEEAAAIAAELESTDRPDYAALIRWKLGQQRTALVTLAAVATHMTAACIALLLPGLGSLIHDERFLDFFHGAGRSDVAHALRALSD